MQRKSVDEVSRTNVVLHRIFSFALVMVFVALVLPDVTQPVLAAPTIIVNPNPVLIPEGKTEGTTTLTWDAGADRSDSRVWLQVDNGKEEIFAASAKGSSEIKVVMDRTYVFRLYSGDGAQVLASITVKGRRPDPPKPSLPKIPQSAPGARPAYIYGVLPDGTLRWYRHDGRGRGIVEWQGPRDITTGLQSLKQVFAGGDDHFYTIASDGALRWYRHSFTDTAGDLPARRNVGNGWQNFKHVFSAGQTGERDISGNAIYAVAQDGTLKWYLNNESSADPPWEGPKDVGRGWGNFKSVFSTGDGIIYAITQDGKLLWHKHNFYKYGVGSEGQGKAGQVAWEGPKEVGRSWQNFKHVFSSGDGIIYAVTKEGKLLWYKHQGYLTGSSFWLGPREVGRAGWENFEHVFALLNPYWSEDRNTPTEVRRVPPVFSTKPESSSFFGGVVVQPGSDSATIFFAPANSVGIWIGVSTHKPNSLPDTTSVGGSRWLERFPPQAKVFYPDLGSPCSYREPRSGPLNCRISGLAPDTTYYFVIYAQYVDIFGDVPPDSDKSPAYFYSGSFRTLKPPPVRPEEIQRPPRRTEPLRPQKP